MTELQFQTEVRCSPERIFELVTDLEGQWRWLPHSSAFQGTEEISENPAVLGTTYREPGRLGVRLGEVTEYDPPTRVTFHQPMKLRLGGSIEITMRYVLEADGGTTNVCRRLSLGLPPVMRPFTPLMMRVFRIENERTLAALKAHAERPDQPA
jgi:uncharacterized protein YndB with AHSA1/START domain